MKVSSSVEPPPPVPPFRPITVTITLDTLDEAAALFQIGNYSSLIDHTLKSDSKTTNGPLPIDAVANELYRELTKHVLLTSKNEWLARQ